ncbi:MAG: holo-ACP synthase [Lentisphaeria bacterium]|nr:holo-ACP synthase [Lentisphaeria bacterium]
MIAGLGNDIVDCRRVQHALENHGEHFIRRVLTEKEMEEGGNALSYVAGRWAAKEAIAKALGFGIGQKCSFAEIQILRDEYGRPCVELAGKTELTAEEQQIRKIHVTISHEHNYAVATAILER